MAVPPASVQGFTGSTAVGAKARLESVVSASLPVVWRFVRRLGVPEHEVDDVVQEVILVMARKLDVIQLGSERSYMMSTAYRVASDHRRSRKRRAEVGVEDAIELSDPKPGPDALTEQRRARELLDQVLESLPLELRAVFVLYELDGLTMAEIAETLTLAPGTVASRLRRGRELFEERVTHLERDLRQPRTQGGDA